MSEANNTGVTEKAYSLSSIDFTRGLHDDMSRISQSKKDLHHSEDVPLTLFRNSSLMTFAGQGIQRESRGLWRPVSPASSDLSAYCIDSSPSRSYRKSPTLMGIYTTTDVEPPHKSGIGSWLNINTSTNNAFSISPRMDWGAEWALLVKRRNDSQSARLNILKNHRLRSRSSQSSHASPIEPFSVRMRIIC